MTTAIIVQARWGSSRLPGKVLRPLGEKTALARVLDRCARIPGVDLVICATPEGEDNDPVAAEAARAGAMVCRGPEQDVLARYAQAARIARCDAVMRITSDCPFLDPAVAGRVLSLLDETGADYSTNDMPTRWPHGLDCEAFSADLLHHRNRISQDAYEREHVTPGMRAVRGLKRATFTGPGGGLERLRWTLDWPEDLAFAQSVFDLLGSSAATASAAELAALCLRRPDLVALNAHRQHPGRLEDCARADFATEPAALAAA